MSQAQAGLSPFVDQLEAHDRIAGMAAVFPTVRDLSAGDVNMITDLLIKSMRVLSLPINNNKPLLILQIS